MQTELYTIQGVENILTPALIYYKDEIFENTRKTIEIAGGAERLWPHVKSHKMKKMIEMLEENDDVQKVYHNCDVDARLWRRSKWLPNAGQSTFCSPTRLSGRISKRLSRS